MIYNITFSPTGGTKSAADILTSGLSEESLFIDLCSPSFEPAELTSDDVAVISVPSYAGRVPCTAAERILMIVGNNARAVLVCVYGNRAYDNTLAELKALAEKAGFRPISAVSAIAEHSMVRKLAAGRPDLKDKTELTEMSSRIKQKLDTDDYTIVQVPGEAPDKPIGNFGGKMAPIAGADCTHCKICAEQCPTQAIDRNTMEADKTKCIGCMRCISVCGSEARKLNIVIESLCGIALSVLCGRRKENELFI